MPVRCRAGLGKVLKKSFTNHFSPLRFFLSSSSLSLDLFLVSLSFLHRRLFCCSLAFGGFGLKQGMTLSVLNISRNGNFAVLVLHTAPHPTEAEEDLTWFGDRGKKASIDIVYIQ